MDTQTETSLLLQCQPSSMSQQQIDALKAPMEEAYKMNARPVQPDNGRPVNLHDEPKKV